LTSAGCAALLTGAPRAVRSGRFTGRFKRWRRQTRAFSLPAWRGCLPCLPRLLPPSGCQQAKTAVLRDGRWRAVDGAFWRPVCPPCALHACALHVGFRGVAPPLQFRSPHDGCLRVLFLRAALPFFSVTARYLPPLPACPTTPTTHHLYAAARHGASASSHRSHALFFSLPPFTFNAAPLRCCLFVQTPLLMQLAHHCLPAARLTRSTSRALPPA